MSDGNTDKMKMKKEKIPILHLGLGQSLTKILSIFLVVFFICAFYIGVTTLANVQPIAKTFAMTSGYTHLQDNRDLISNENIIEYFDLYIYDESQFQIGELGLSKLNSPDFDNYAIETNEEILDYNIMNLTEKEFSKMIEFFKMKDRLDGKIASSPCQLYSYLWAKYYDYNNYTYKYHFIKGHTFIIVEKPFGYSVVDQQDIIDVQLG